jgi:hypothetical protein
MTFFEFLRFREATQDLGHVLVHFLVLFLAAVLEISFRSLRGVSFLHRAPLITVGMIVEVVFHCGFRLLLKGVKVLGVVTEQPAPEIPLQATSINHGKT